MNERLAALIDRGCAPEVLVGVDRDRAIEGLRAAEAFGGVVRGPEGPLGLGVGDAVRGARGGRRRGVAVFAQGSGPSG